MSVKAGNFTGALVVAAALALPFVVPTILRIDTWKIVLALAGLALFVGGGLQRS